MMTSAGSKRALGALVGVSHQRIGRWLEGEHVNMHSGEITNVPRDPAILAAIDQAFSMHRDVSRQQARHDRLPFDPELPVYMERKPFKDGRPGERVIAEHTNFMSNQLRERAIVSAGKSGAFLNVSVRSTVDLRKYNSRANSFARSEKFNDRPRTEAQIRWRDELKNALDEGIEQRPMYTQKEDFFRIKLARGEVAAIKQIPGEIVSSRINDKLAQKHEPAIGEHGTKLADQLLFQTIPQIRETGKPQHAKKATRGNRPRTPKASRKG